MLLYMTVKLLLTGPKCNFTLRYRNAGEERRPHSEWTFKEGAAKLQHITLPDDEHAKVTLKIGAFFQNN